MNGFTFCGKHSSEFGLWHIPSPANRMQNMPDFELREGTVTGRHGGYYYGSQVKIREITLECYFEEITIKTFEDMMRWLSRDEGGEQTLDDRSFVSYDAIVWKKPTGKVYSVRSNNSPEEVYSGTMSVFFRCYEPFGKMAYISYDAIDEDGAESHCGILKKGEMPSPIEPAAGTYLVYNPGTEPCGATIRIAGRAPNGLMIENSFGDKCKILSLPESGYLEIDGNSGTVKAMPADELAFEYHDEGYIQLAPCTPYERDVVVSYMPDSNVVSFMTKTTSSSMVGRYIRLAGEWVKIVSLLSENDVVVSKRMPYHNTEQTMITTMNELTISGDELSLTMFELDYVPLLR